MAQTFVQYADGLPVGGAAYDVSTSVTRPANTTIYTALDVVGATAAAITFLNVGPSGRPIKITGVELEFDTATVLAATATFRLHLFNVTPPSAIADNATFDLASGDRASYLGFVAISTTIADIGATQYVAMDGLNKQIRLSSNNLFAYLQTVEGYTPAENSTVFKVTLHTVAA